MNGAQRRIPWEPPKGSLPRSASAFAVSLPFFLGAIEKIRVHQLSMLLTLAGLALGLSSYIATTRRSLSHALLIIATVQAPHFIWATHLYTRNTRYLLDKYSTDDLLIPSIAYAFMALSDILEICFVVFAWMANRNTSHEVTDRFLQIAGAWLVLTSLFRWPPLLAAFDLSDLITGNHLRWWTLRTIVQIVVGIVLLVRATWRINARAMWIRNVSESKDDIYKIVSPDSYEMELLKSLPLLSRLGEPRVLARMEPVTSVNRPNPSPLARIGSFDHTNRRQSK